MGACLEAKCFLLDFHNTSMSDFWPVLLEAKSGGMVGFKEDQLMVIMKNTVWSTVQQKRITWALSVRKATPGSCSALQKFGNIMIKCLAFKLKVLIWISKCLVIKLRTVQRI